MTAFEEYVLKRWTGTPLDEAGHPVPYPMVAALGLAGETGEVMEHLKKHYRDGTHPGEDLCLELGDVLHYLTVIALSYGWSLDRLMTANMRKLAKRDAKRAKAGKGRRP